MPRAVTDPFNKAELESLLLQQQRGYRSNRFLEAVRPKVHIKQKWFLALDDYLEVFYGGAAGGGKSDALLDAALQYVDIPGYSAILFRRTYADLSLAGALMDRMNQWLTGVPGAYKRDGGKLWEFEGGGKIQFAYLANEGDEYRYQGAEFQFVGFDEASHIPENARRYLFSRLRRPEGTSSDNPLAKVPLRMRLASNPGGKYGESIKNTYVPKQYIRSTPDEQFSKVWMKQSECTLCSGKGRVEVRGEEEICFACSGEGKSRKVFVPARLEDNPSIDLQAYESSLSHLPPAERAQLRHGRWDIVSEGNLFQRSWIRRWKWRGSSEHIEIQSMTGWRLVDESNLSVFITADTASTTKSTSDYTCICAWFLCKPRNEICLLDVIRKKMLIPHIFPAIKEMYKKWDANLLIIEEASSGYAVIQEAFLSATQSMNLLPFNPSKGGHGANDKVSRSGDAQNMMMTGMAYFPEGDDDTIMDCINELLLFPDSEHDDFVDNFSMAGYYASGKFREKKRNQGGSPGAMLRPGVTHHKFNQY